MLFSAFSSGDMKTALLTLLLTVPAVIVALSVHEAAHGLAAWMLGDRTASRAGRLTLDPMAHIDPAGFLCMLLLGFGWARPVPVNVSGFRMKNRKLGMAIVGMAGPLSNFILAFIAFIVYFILQINFYNTDSALLEAVLLFLSYTGMLSVGLGVFNLIPVHPLDGSHLLNMVLPFKAQVKLREYQSIILLAMIAIVYFGGLDVLIVTVRVWIYQGAAQLVFAVMGLL